MSGCPSALPDERTQHDADEPAEERKHERSENTRPQETVDVQAEAEQSGNPADKQQQQGVDDERDEPEREDVKREGNNADEVADDPIDDSENQRHDQVGQDDSERVCGRERGHGDSGHYQGGQPECDGVNEKTNEQSSHPITMPVALDRRNARPARNRLDGVTNSPADPSVRLRPEILAAAPYRQGKPAPADSFKLSSNENPFDPLPEVLEAIASGAVNRYPDAAATALSERLAERFGVSRGGVHVGSGSVSILAQLIQAAAGPGDEVLYSWRSFEAYPGLVTVAGAHSVMVPNLPDHRHDVSAMAAAVTDKTRVAIICTPNNPTGTIVAAAEFHGFMNAVPENLLVLLDEAYVEFVTDASAVNGRDLLGQYPNLVILRTFSKAFGLAGLRVGYAVGPERILDAARATAIPLSVTQAAQSAAIAALDHEDQLMERVAVLTQRRDELVDAVRAQGWPVPLSQANFLWLATGPDTAAANDILLSHGIVARALLPDGIRVSVGEAESVQRVLEATAHIAEALPSVLISGT